MGSGSGEMDDATEVLESLPTVLYQEPTTIGKKKKHHITLCSLKKKHKFRGKKNVFLKMFFVFFSVGET